MKSACHVGRAGRARPDACRPRRYRSVERRARASTGPDATGARRSRVARPRAHRVLDRQHDRPRPVRRAGPHRCGRPVVPGVALSWERKSPTTWIFKLRRDAKWSNGQPVTAADFVYSWQRLVDPKTAEIHDPRRVHQELEGHHRGQGRAVDARRARGRSVHARSDDRRARRVLPRADRDGAARAGEQGRGREVRRCMDAPGQYRQQRRLPARRLAAEQPHRRDEGREVLERAEGRDQQGHVPADRKRRNRDAHVPGQIDYSYSIPSGIFQQVSKQFGGELRQACSSRRTTTT